MIPSDVLDKLNKDTQARLERLMSMQFKNIPEIIQRLGKASFDGVLSDTNDNPVLLSDADVECLLNPIWLNLFKAAGPEVYGELIDTIKKLNLLFIKQLEKLVYCSGHIPSSEFTQRTDQNKAICESTYGKGFFATERLIDELNQFKNFDINQYKRKEDQPNE